MKEPKSERGRDLSELTRVFECTAGFKARVLRLTRLAPGKNRRAGPPRRGSTKGRLEEDGLAGALVLWGTAGREGGNSAGETRKGLPLGERWEAGSHGLGTLALIHIPRSVIVPLFLLLAGPHRHPEPGRDHKHI